ncbi:Hyalin [Lysobacter dokdonensis DS-58]|uniref:Hyalin n=1 Tax=Lysobacter dokdonensis DS-58 TaxID=1300345 RepID=A0A0A2WKY3_9GAMM|nr:HYR domain-containing protein [Lysobacter dokdonensis]KGQ20841.1 Hyalin [Lysobacter dokdonensis DS-58]
MRTHLATGRGWGLFGFAILASLVAAPTWAACNGNPNARIDPGTQTVPERTGSAATIVTLDGSGSTPKNDDVVLSWQYLGSTPAGLSVTLNNPNTAKPTFASPNVGVGGASLRFRLTVTCGGTNSLETVVNVTDVLTNSPPTASAFISPLNPTEGQLVTLDGSASFDPDPGQSLTYTWTQISGTPIVALTNASANGSIKTFIAPNVPTTRTLGFRLTVSDGTLSAIADRTVNITWTNDPPIAALACPAGGVRVVDEGQSVTFDASASHDPDGAIAAYAWSQNVGLPNLGIGALTTASITFTAPQLGYNQLGGMTVTATVTDGSGVSASAACGLFINDRTAPVLVVPVDKLEEATSPVGAQVFYIATKQDAVEDALPVPIACTPPSGNVFALDASTTVACSAVDTAGNASNASFKISVVDTTPPTLSVPGDTMVEATGPSGAIGTFVATTSDLVDGNGAAACTPPSGSVFPLGDTLVTCSAADAHHNAASDKTFTFSVADSTPPTVAVPATITKEATSPAGANATFVVSANDVVDGALTPVCKIGGNLVASGDVFALGTNHLQCAATDTAGNTGTAGFDIIVQDTTPPALSLPDDLVEEATSAAGAIVSFTATANDIVSGNVPVTCTPSSGAQFALGHATVHCSATDGASNTASGSFDVHVRDTTPPALTLPADFDVEATSPAGAAVGFTATANDLVSGDVPVTCTPASGTTLALGPTTVSCSATDDAGNAGNGSFVATVVDTTPPALVVPADITSEATSAAGAVVTFATSASDIVSGNVPTTCMPLSGTTFALGAATVACTAIDGAGNTGSATFKVTVVDTTPPQLTVPANIIEEATSPAGATVHFTPTATDLVDANVAIVCTPASNTTFGLGITTVSCTATDDAGNSSGGSFTVTVRDTTAPTLHLPADFTREATSAAGAAATYVATADDIVDTSVTATCLPLSGSTFPLGYTTVACSATDDAGNSANGSFKVRVVDTTAPTIAAHADVDATAQSNSQAAVTYTNPTATDLVDGNLATTCVLASGSTFAVGATTVTCTATDEAGNTRTSTFKVNVRYAFNGFFRPIDNLPIVNSVNAGQAIPVKFSLGGNQGLQIFAAGWPKVAWMACQANTVQDVVEETVTAGNSSLSYSADGQYNYVWKTDKAWAGTCRQLQLKFADGTTQTAHFIFKK